MTTGARVALRNDSYTLHLLLPTKVCRLRICSLHGQSTADRVHRCAPSWLPKQPGPCTAHAEILKHIMFCQNIPKTH